MRSYLAELAEEIKLEVAPQDLPDEDTRDLFLVYAVLLLAKGEGVTAEDVHNGWAAWQTMRGEDHESLRPFDELSPSTRQEDLPFVDAIRAVARRLRDRNPGLA